MLAFLPKLGIRSKLTVLIALGMLFPLLIATVLIISRVQDQLLAASRERLAADSKLVAVQVEAMSSCVRNALKQLAADPDVIDADPVKRQLAISQVMAATDNFDAIRITGPDGILQNPPPGVAPVSYADRKWFKALLAGAPFAQEVVFGRISGELSVVSGVPVMCDGQLIAILAGVRLSSRVAAAVGVMYPTNGGHQAVFDAAGDLVTGVQSTPPPAVLAMKQIANGHFIGNSECMIGSKKYLAHTAELADGWTVVTIRNAAEATKASFATLTWAASVFAVAVLAAFTGGWLIVGSISGPIRETALAAKAMVTGDLTQRVRIHGVDELATLGESFNAMADALGVQHREIEYRVAARTSELAAANRKLETGRKIADAAGLAKSNFLANVSHEFRTPMMAIGGYCELMQDPHVSPEDRQAYLGSVLRNVRTLTQIVGDVLDLSRVETGAIEVRTEPCIFRDALAGATSGALETAAIKKLSLQITVDSDVPRTIRTDGRRFRQLVANLVGNAVKFTEHGEVSVSVSWSAWAQPGPDDGAPTLHESLAGMLRIDVADNGPGMTAAEVARVREPFFQADATSTRKNGGLGTGLPLSFAIAEALGGWIEIIPFDASGGTRVIVELPADACLEDCSAISQPADADRRTTCSQIRVTPACDPAHTAEVSSTSLAPSASLTSRATLTAPAACAAPAMLTLLATLAPPSTHITLTDAATTVGEMLAGSSQSQLAVKPKPLAGKRVLIVDDGEDNRRLLKAHSLAMGAAVELAEHGQQAVDLVCAAAAAGRSFDLVLLDMQMPVMDGYSAATELRSMGYQFPIIAVTAHALAGDRDKCLRAGCSDYLAKPVQRDRMRETIERNLPIQASVT